MGKIIPLVSFGSTSQLGSSGDPGGWCVSGILMGCPSHLSWLLFMQRSSSEPSDSLRLSQLLTHLLSLTWHPLPESSSCGSGLFQCHEVTVFSSWRLYCGCAEKRYREKLRTSLFSALSSQGGKLTLFFKRNPFQLSMKSSGVVRYGISEAEKPHKTKKTIGWIFLLPR